MPLPSVSVYCLVYNHEKYLRQCLESVLTQDTPFPYEVVVHDDASTDNSAAIIQEFETRFPKKMIPIYQTENQFGRTRGGIIRNFIEPKVRGRYLAICEGDDYWSSPDKLKKQFDALEAHPECGMCLHRTREVTETGEETGLEYPAQSFQTGFLPAEDVFRAIEPRMFQTTSYFFRADLWHEYVRNPPSYRAVCPMGDVPLLLYFASHFGVWHLEETLSCYRRGGASSWTSSRLRVDEARLIRHASGVLETYRLFDAETKGRFHELCVRRMSKYLYALCAHSKDFRPFWAPENRDCLKIFPFLKRWSVGVGIVFPGLLRKMYLRHLQKKERHERTRWQGLTEKVKP